MVKASVSAPPSVPAEREGEGQLNIVNIVWAVYVRACGAEWSSQPASRHQEQNKYGRATHTHTVAVELVALERVLARLLELARRCVV